MVRRTGAAVVVVALALAGCSDGDPPAGDDAAPATTTDPGRDTGEETDTDAETPQTLDLQPETTTTTTPDDTALADLLIDEAAEGFEPTTDGPLDLDAAAGAEVDSEAEEALLETRSFERGWARSWSTESGEVAYVAAYDFGSAQDAGLYLEDGAQTLLARGATSFEVPEVEGARGVTTIEEDADGSFTAHAVAFTRDDRWFLVLAGSTGSGATPDVARQLARAQSERAATG